MVGKRKVKTSYSDKIFDTVNILIMVVLLVVFIWPLWFVLISSFSDPAEVMAGHVVLWPKGTTLHSYQELFQYERIWLGYRNSLFYTVVGTALNMVMTVLCAYPLSRKDWMPRNLFMKMCLLTMYFGGGLIPVYLVVKKLGLVDSMWAMIIPGAMSFYNALIVRSYFMNSIPNELKEAADLDGANPLQYLLRVVLPLSKPVLAVVGLYYAVGHWNDYYTALIYIYDRDKAPLQTVLRDVLMSASAIKDLTTNASTSDAALTLAERIRFAQSLKYTSIIVAILPMMIIYPFIQKYFVKGVMVGGIKG